MTYSTVELSKLYEHRYKFVASIYNLQIKEFVQNFIITLS